MLKFISVSVLLLLLQGCEGKSNSKSSDENAPSAVVDDPRTPSQPVDNTTPLIIHGHILPPEPDPNINSATLLGVDVNYNGVRDDVERWIYMTYKNPIEIGLFMQSARAYQKVIEDPSKALKTKVFIQNAVRCESSWSMDNEAMKLRNLSYTFGEYRSLEDEIKHIQFNTRERHIAYLKFNETLSGGVYSNDVEPDDWIESCEFDKHGFLRD